MRYTERLEEAEVLRSVGSKGDSYDIAAAESLNGLYKTELIRRRGPWRGLDDVELATLEYVDWFNHRRLHSHCGDIPPVEFEDNYYRQIAGLTEDQPAEPSLHCTRGGSPSSRTSYGRDWMTEPDRVIHRPVGSTLT